MLTIEGDQSCVSFIVNVMAGNTRSHRISRNDMILISLQYISRHRWNGQQMPIVLIDLSLSVTCFPRFALIKPVNSS